ncbi:MAG: hypothetical protein WKF85_04145 [Chitinophagaceae bacterium]
MILEDKHHKKVAPVFDLVKFQNPEPVEISAPEEKESYRDKFLKSILNQHKDYPAPQPVVNLKMFTELIVFMTLKSFSLWQGKQKSKKTIALAIVVAAFIRNGNSLDQIQFVGVEKGVALFFDTEQGESYAARTMKLILKLSGVESSPYLIYCDLREYSPLERKKIIEAGIQSTPGVKLVIIDGVVDLLNDFMDAGEGHLTAIELLKLSSTYNIHIAVVLHQNKNDKNPRAHIGTIVSQKSEMEISTEVDPEDRAQSIVSCVNSRGLPFEPFAIRWDKGSLPCISQGWSITKRSDSKANRNYEKNKEIAESVFKPLTALPHKEAVNGIMNASLKSESTAKRLLNDFTGWGLIDKGEDGNYRIKIKEGSKVHEGSNEGS